MTPNWEALCEGFPNGLGRLVAKVLSTADDRAKVAEALAWAQLVASSQVPVIGAGGLMVDYDRAIARRFGELLDGLSGTDRLQVVGVLAHLEGLLS